MHRTAIAFTLQVVIKRVNVFEFHIPIIHLLYLLIFDKPPDDVIYTVCEAAIDLIANDHCFFSEIEEERFIYLLTKALKRVLTSVTQMLVFLCLSSFLSCFKTHRDDWHFFGKKHQGGPTL
jgi:hypothetical protein